MAATICPRTHDFVVSRSTQDNRYGLWRFDPDARELLTAVPLSPNAACDRRETADRLGDDGAQQLHEPAPIPVLAGTAVPRSIWKVLWANGFTDWKIYHSTVWYDYVFTYQLFLEGQIPTVDAHLGDDVAEITQFLDDAKSGNLPAFSYLEPYWIAPNGTTSCHPGEDIVPAERQLNAIYDALREGPAGNRRCS